MNLESLIFFLIAVALGSYVQTVTGFAAGSIGGLFSTGEPPLVYHLYRQPISTNVIRTTLLAIFLISSLARIVIVGVQGQINIEVIDTVCFLSPW